MLILTRRVGETLMIADDVTVTWPGYLCICGDMGEYVFKRVPDMFRFFRSDNAEDISPYYWSEKLQAEPRSSNQGKQWSLDTFKASVQKFLSNNTDDEADLEPEELERQREVIKEAKEAVEIISDEYEAVDFIRTFECNDFTFDDFWEYSTTEYTFHYLWCCYAIVWGIQQYDRTKAEAVNP